MRQLILLCLFIITLITFSKANDNQLNRLLNLPATPLAVVNSDTFALVLNEIMASNTSTVNDNSGEYADWIEIYNGSEHPVNISGFYLTDEMSDLTKWRISEQEDTSETLLEAGSFQLFWADGDTSEGWFHTLFEIDENGDTLALVYKDGSTVVDSIILEKLDADISYGRANDGDDRWRTFVDPTPGASNNIVTELRPPSDLYVFPTPDGAQLSWDFWRPDLRLSSNNGVPGGIWALPENAGMGVVFDLSGYPGAKPEQVDFLHYGKEVFSGNSRYVIQLFDMEAELKIGATDTLIAEDAFDFPRFELGVNLPDTLPDVNMLGVFIEPFSLREGSTSPFPSVMTDTSLLVPNTSYATLNFDDLFNNLYGVDMFDPTATNVVIDLWLDTAEGERILLKHNQSTEKGFGVDQNPGLEIYAGPYRGKFERIDPLAMLSLLETDGGFNIYRGAELENLENIGFVANSERSFFDMSAPVDSGYIYAVTSTSDTLESRPDTLYFENPQMMSAIEIRSDSDADFVPDRLGQTVAIIGVISSPDFDGGDGGAYYLQDQYGGIHMVSGYHYDLLPGDEIYLAGKVRQHAGLDYISPVDSNYIQLLAYGKELDTLDLEISGLGETVESRLIKLGGLQILDKGQWPAEGNSGNIRATDGTDTLQILIDQDTDLDGWQPASDFWDVTGLVSQSTESIPADDGYFLIPRYLSDFSEAEEDTTSVGSESEIRPLKFRLHQNYPNPFNPVTIIRYTVGSGSVRAYGNTPQLETHYDASLAKVNLSVYNLLGQKVASLVSEKQLPGTYTVKWNAKEFPSGIYFYKLETNTGIVKTQKMILLR